MEKLMTRWGREIGRDMPLSEYPRPQLRRDSYFCLNGVWDYAVYPEAEGFGGWQGDIIVPFSPESILSGVQKIVSPSDVLYYRRVFDFHKTGGRVLLHFGAVDYECEVHLNSIEIGSHRGGYFPFVFDITDAVCEGANTLTLKVRDPSETSYHARGKQTSKRGNIWYTPQSGIWQTVWIEEVPDNYISDIKITPDIDSGCVRLEAAVCGSADSLEAAVFDGGEMLCSAVSTKKSLVLKLNSFELWSPENPKLYDLEIKAGKDCVKSYFAMRKFSAGTDGSGVPRFFLNNKPYFQSGLLDQGYWSDGLYTAPSDEALIYDIETAKSMGFNMLRKHIKVEPLRWYYHCDRLGMLVWQDMINGGGKVKMPSSALIPFAGLLGCTKNIGILKDTSDNYKLFSREDKAGRDEYYADAQRLISTLYNSPSICLWTPFNEGWGQFDAVKAAEFFRKNDSTRLIDHASGWHDQGAGDINSFHIYFTPFSFPRLDKNDKRITALTEFGGYSMSVSGHCFNPKKTFGYRVYKNKQKLEAALDKLYMTLLPLVRKQGLSALVYTQLSDVEDETNGLLTYDREIVKVSPMFIKRINEKFRSEFR